MENYKLYHYDTFDNSAVLLEEFQLLNKAVDYAILRYGDRICDKGADYVDIVNKDGELVWQRKVT